MGEIITFYSYKGGTGRTMALANVGHILAWQLGPPRKVLMIDWDLEAPGLQNFFFEQLKINFSYLNIENYPNWLNRAPGLIDFLDNIKTFYKNRYPDGELGVIHAETPGARIAFSDALSSHLLAKYTLTVAPPIRSDDPPAGLFLIKAGDQTSSRYLDLIRSFEWETFYERYGSFFTLFCEYLKAEYDYVLIDSRTGLTDIGYLCTRVMPEKLVGVFVPNEQNVEGLIRVLGGAAEYRLVSRDPRGLIIFPLASRIDPARSFLRNAWWKGGMVRDHKVVGYEPRFEEFIKSMYRLETCDLDRFFDSTQLPHDSDYAFGEEVAARDDLSGRLTISYACTNLARYLIEDSVPWEELPTAVGSAPPPMAPPAVETARRLAKYAWPTLVASAGLLIVLLGPSILGTDIVFNYQWPIALTATAVGGTLIGFAIQGWLIARSGFRSPLLGTRLLINAAGILISLALVGTYWSVFSHLIVPAYRYQWAPTMLLAATGPLLLYWSLRKISVFVSKAPASKSG
jgi:cellulose biosynthesis protein BcsQ